LVCPGNPDCVITSAGVNCASGCTVTSAGLLCPEGGEVEGTPPVSGGPRKKPIGKVRGERKTNSGGARGVNTGAGATGTEETSSDALPFTGAPMIALLAFGFALWAGGLLLRRRTAPVPTVAEVPAQSEPLEAVHRSMHSAEPRPRGTPVLGFLALLGLGVLLFRRARP
jgi:MYXO-CTERM domain-containing protein